MMQADAATSNQTRSPICDEGDFSYEECCNPWSQDIFDETNLEPVSV
jgi:hypothetical protein